MHGVAPGLAFAMPSLWRPRRRVRVDWANTFKIDEAFARSRVGVDRSLLAFQSVPTHLYDPDDVLKIRDTAARRSMRVTIRRSPGRRKSTSARSSSRPSVIVPAPMSSQLRHAEPPCDTRPGPLAFLAAHTATPNTHPQSFVRAVLFRQANRSPAFLAAPTPLGLTQTPDTCRGHEV
jgi:hypothetical protein